MRALAIKLALARVNVVVPGMVIVDLWSGFLAEIREHAFRETAAKLLVGRWLWTEVGPLSCCTALHVRGQDLIVVTHIEALVNRLSVWLAPLCRGCG